MGAWGTFLDRVRSLLHLARRMRPWAQGQWGILAGGWAAMLLEVVLRLAEPWPLKVLFDHLFASGKAPTSFRWAHTMEPVKLLLVCVGAMVALSVLRSVCSWGATVGLALVGNRVLTRCRKDLFDHLLQLPLAYHLGAKRGDLLNRVIGDVGRVQEIAVTALLPFVTHLLTLAGMLAVMLWMDVRLGIVALGVVPAFALLSTLLGRRLRDVARQQRRREGDMASSAGEALGAIRVAQAYGLERVLGAAFDRQNTRSLSQGVRGARLSAGLERSVDIVIAVATAVVVWLGAQRAMHGELSPGDLVVFMSYLRSAFRPVKDAAKFAGRIAKAAASGERILEVLDAVPAVRDRRDAVALPGPITSIEFRGVTFGHRVQGDTLSNVHFRVQRGQRLVLAGESGAGKSTVLNLVLRLYEVGQGSIQINGRDARDWTLGSLRQQMAVVLQESILFAATVRENIACAAPGASLDDVIAAAKLAGAHAFIMELPQGYVTIVAERGETLSGGQRQRIAIARAAVRNASVLLLDEPATGLDHHTKVHVRRALEQLGRDRIVVLIAHDLSEVQGDDHVVFLEHGEVIESGAHDDLVRAGGRYADLVTAQRLSGDQHPETAHVVPG